MDFELFAIAITVFHGIAIMVAIFGFLGFRNIFTQKILFLNEQLATLDVESRMGYEIHPYIEFDMGWKGDFGYPPPFKIQYMVNPTYASLYRELDERRAKLGKRIMKIALSFVISMAVLGIVYLFAR